MRKIFTFAAAVLASLTMMAQTYTTLEVDGEVSTWSFPERSSAFSVQASTPITDNGIIFEATSNGKIKFQTAGYLSCLSESSIYIPVPANSEGTIAMTTSSSSDSRYFQLFIDGTEGTEAQRLWSKYSETVTSDYKKGPQSFAYSASDITTYNNETYLHFKDNNTEMKIATFVLTVTGSGTPSPTYTVTYKANNGSEAADVIAEEVKKVAANPFEAEEGFAFAGWNTAADGTGDTYAVGATLTSDLTLYAQWTAITTCTILTPAQAGEDPEIGDEIALDVNSEGGQIFVADLKTEGDIKYTASGLQIGGGSKDSIRVELYNYLQEGSIITLKLAAGGTSERGLNLQTVSKSTVFAAKWTPTENGEEKTFTYTIPAGSPLIGTNKFLLQRNNTVYLQYLSVANCGAEVEGIEIDTDPVLIVSKDEVNLEITAAQPTASATVLFSGKYLTPGTYPLEMTAVDGLTINPTSVTVGENGKFSQLITINYVTTEENMGQETLSLTIDELTAEVEISYSAEFEKNYIESINIEEWILDNGLQNDAFHAELEDANIEYANINDLDSLNNNKGAARNEAYLGLKLKATGAYMAGWVEEGSTIRVKFGYVAAAVKVFINDTEESLTPTSERLDVFEYTAAADTYIKFATTTGGTVVFKQIMIDEDIEDVMYPITYTAGENGAVSGWTIAFPGEDVTVAIAPEAGYLTYSLTYNGVALHDDENTGAATFTMPAEAVSVVASFVTDFPTAVENTEVGVKAVKRIMNSQIIIEKNGKFYNVLGAQLH